MAKRRLWTREELILAFSLYLEIPFGQINASNPKIIYLANLIDRTANSVSIRLSNYASCDPYHQQRGVVGMQGGASVCQPIWDEFSQNKESLVFESEIVLAKLENTSLEKKYEIDQLIDNKGKGYNKVRQVKTRVNQNVFRRIVMANYSYKCAITEIDIPELLVASHIVPWSKNESERLNPENGICLSNLYDKAFDMGFIGLNNELRILLSKELKKNAEENYFNTYFAPIENRKIQQPIKYLPSNEFINYHLNTVFAKRN